MERAIIYARVSTADQETANQVRQLQDYADTQGWQVVEEILDVCSGSKNDKERNGLGRIFVLAHQRQFDVLLIWSLDRFSREGSRVTIGYLTRLEQFGVGWHSFTEPYLSTLGPFSDSIIALLAALAKQERLRIGERTRAGLERARANGKRLGRPRTEPKRFQMAKELRDQGLSFGKIATRLGVSRSRAHQLVQANA